MRSSKPAECDGKTWYQKLYREDINREAQAAELAAAGRVSSIREIVERNHLRIETLAEFGCGTGEVILGCRATNIGTKFYGIDSSDEAIRYFKKRAPDIHCLVEDINSPDFSFVQPVDLLILSHVLEHLEGPGAFLEWCVAQVDFRYMIVEVPLEHLPLMKIKTKLTGRKNLFGHINFFTPHTFRRLLRQSGLRVLDERIYAHIMTPDALRYVARTEGRSRGSMMATYLARRFMPIYFGPIWKRLYYAHHSVLCTRI